MTLQEKFNNFHSENQHIYESFKSTACSVIFKAKSKGVKYLSFDMIAHICRYQSWNKPEGEDYKLNNNWVAYYGRMFLKEYPWHVGYFRIKKTEAEKAEGENPGYVCMKNHKLPSCDKCGTNAFYSRYWNHGINNFVEKVCGGCHKVLEVRNVKP